MLESDTFRTAMSRLGAAVNIITTGGHAGRHGFTASAVCSVTDAPPTLLVCMNRNVSAASHFSQGSAIAVNVLSSQHEELSGLFAGRTTDMIERFAGGSWTVGKTGAPLLCDASAAFDCRIAEVKDIGTHRILFCQVEDALIGVERDSLIYVRRRYHHVS